MTKITVTSKLDYIRTSTLKILYAATKLRQSCPTLRPHRRQPTRLCRPWDSPGKNTGVGCHFLQFKKKNHTHDTLFYFYIHPKV